VVEVVEEKWKTCGKVREYREGRETFSNLCGFDTSFFYYVEKNNLKSVNPRAVKIVLPPSRFSLKLSETFGFLCEPKF
jgi:hypothetical protein